VIVKRRDERDDYQSWLWGEILIFGLLAAGLAAFASTPGRRSTFSLPELRLFLDTAVLVAGILVAVLAGVRFSVEGRKLDLLLCAGFAAAAGGTLAFAIGPVIGGEPIHRAEAWAGVAVKLIAAGLIALAPFAHGRISARGRALTRTAFVLAALIVFVWLAMRWLESELPVLGSARHQQPFLLAGALAVQALLALITLIGFGLRFRAQREDFDRWLALAATLTLFAGLQDIFTPIVSSRDVALGDFLRLLSYVILLVGVWRAIRSAEFGRAVAEERARVAREIHDGLAQYLFAVSTHVNMLENGADPATAVPRLKEAAALAQQEARFAVLALSSASGNAPFDAALRRYVEFLTADGELEVELEVDAGVRLGPDEQIEVFRIVQEGLANVRKHAGARTAYVTIGAPDGRRLVRITDDGAGFDGEIDRAGQGLRNIRMRAAAIGGGFRLRTSPGRGTALEVTLRA
jgi:signal transduction histidine kinase